MSTAVDAANASSAGEHRSVSTAVDAAHASRAELHRSVSTAVDEEADGARIISWNRRSEPPHCRLRASGCVRAGSAGSFFGACWRANVADRILIHGSGMRMHDSWSERSQAPV